MRPIIIMTVGYITGIIWGLYLKINIIPIIFLTILVGILKKDKKMSIIFFLIFLIISNTQINYLENKYKKLYEGINNVEIIGTIISEKKELEYKEKYTIKVEKINGDKKYKNTKLIIYTKSNKKIEYGKKIKIIRRI